MPIRRQRSDGLTQGLRQPLRGGQSRSPFGHGSPSRTGLPPPLRRSTHLGQTPNLAGAAVDRAGAGSDEPPLALAGEQAARGRPSRASRGAERTRARLVDTTHTAAAADRCPRGGQASFDDHSPTARPRSAGAGAEGEHHTDRAARRGPHTRRGHCEERSHAAGCGSRPGAPREDRAQAHAPETRCCVRGSRRAALDRRCPARRPPHRCPRVHRRRDPSRPRPAGDEARPDVEQAPRAAAAAPAAEHPSPSDASAQRVMARASTTSEVPSDAPAAVPHRGREPRPPTGVPESPSAAESRSTRPPKSHARPNDDSLPAATGEVPPTETVRRSDRPAVARASTGSETTSRPRPAGDEARADVERAPRAAADQAATGDRPGPSDAPAQRVVARTTEPPPDAPASTRDATTSQARPGADEAWPDVKQAPRAATHQAATGERPGPSHAPAQPVVARADAPSVTRASTRDGTASQPRPGMDEALPDVEQASRAATDQAATSARPGPSHAQAQRVVARTSEPPPDTRDKTTSRSSRGADEARPDVEQAHRAATDRPPTAVRPVPPTPHRNRSWRARRRAARRPPRAPVRPTAQRNGHRAHEDEQRDVRRAPAARLRASPPRAQTPAAGARGPLLRRLRQTSRAAVSRSTRPEETHSRADGGPPGDGRPGATVGPSPERGTEAVARRPSRRTADRRAGRRGAGRRQA